MRTYKKKTFSDVTNPFRTIDFLHVQSKLVKELELIPWDYKGISRDKHLNLAYAVISTINHSFWRIPKEKRKSKKFVRLNSAVLQRFVGDFYNPVCMFLSKAGIIQRKNKYWNSGGKGTGKCKEFRISPMLADGVCESIAVYGPYKFPDRLRRAIDEARTRPLISAQHELVRRNTFKLRLTCGGGALFYLNHCFKKPKSARTIQSQSSYIDDLASLHGPFRNTEKNDSWFTVDDYGRCYSSFTHLFKQARSNINLDGEPIVGIDIHASHWFHALMLWPNRSSAEGKKILRILTEGDLYEFVMKEWNLKDRSDAKKLLLKFLHSHPERMSDETAENCKKLSLLFPNFARWIQDQKKGPKNRNSHKPFSNALMREESARVILDAVGKLSAIDPEYPVVTLHDGLYVPRCRAGEALEVFQSVYQDCYGTVPKISIEPTARAGLPVGEIMELFMSGSPVEDAA